MPASIADSSLESPSAASKEALMLLERKLLDLAFGKVKFSVISALLLASLIVIALWSVIEHERLLAWLAGIAGVKVLHFLYLHRYRRHGHRADVDPGKWQTGLVIGAAAAGLGWGSAVFCFPSSPFNPMTLFGVFVLPSTPFDPVTVLLIFILAGITAYASVALAFVPLAAFAFFACAWLPLAIWLFSFGEQMYVVMGLIALSYLGVMVMLSRRMHATVCSLISVSEENRGLRTAQQESDWRMQRFFESAPGFFYTACMTPDGKSSMPFASAGIHELFDLAPGEVADSMSSLFALVRAEDIERVIKEREASRRNLSPFRIEFRINHRIKGERWIELNSMPQRAPDGSTNWHGFMQNITDRRRLEESLAAREREFRTLAENFPDVVIRYDLDGRRTYVNRALAELAGTEPDEMLGKFLEDTPLVDPEAYIAELQKVIATLDASILEVAARGTNGEISWYQARFVPEFDAGNNVSGVLMVAGDITVRRRMEQELQRSETEFRTLAENLPVAVIRYDAEQRRRYINPVAERMLHGNMAELLGKIPGDGGVPATPAMIEHYRGKMKEVLATGEARELDFALDELPAGRLEYFEVRFVPERDADGQAAGVLAIWFDITERKRMENEMRQQANFRETLLNAINEVGLQLMVIEEGRINYASNLKLSREFGYGEEEIAAGVPLMDILHPDDRARVMDYYLRRVAGEASPNSYELSLVTKRGERREYETSVAVLPGTSPLRMISVGKDITERKRMEDDLRLKESVLDQASDSVYLIDENARFVYVNDEACRALGYSRNELLVMGVGDIDYAMSNESSLDVREKTLEQGGYSFVTQHRRRDGSLFPVEIQASTLTYQGKHLGLALARDISERKAIERSLHDSERMLQEAQRIAHVGSWDVDMVNDKLVWSDEIFRIWEIDKAQFKADFAAFLETVHPEDQERVVQAYNDAVINHTLYEVEHRLLFPDGRVKHILERGEPQYDAGGKPVRFIGTSLDITERKIAEQYEQFRSHTLELLAGNNSLPDILDEIVRGVEHLNSRMLCSLLLLDSEGKHLVEGIAPSLPDFYNEAINGLEIGMGVGSCGTCAATGERVIVEDIQTHPYWAAFKELTARAGLGACWSQPVRSSSGKVLGTFAIYHREAHSPTALDISLIEKVAHIASIAIERKRMEAVLAVRERDFRSLAENLPNNIARWDRQGRYVYINPGLDRLFGGTENVIGKTKSEAFPDGRFAEMEAIILSVVASGKKTTAPRQLVPDEHGEMRLHDITLVPEFDAAGQVVGVLGIGHDMTDIYRMQDELAARERDFRSLAENLPDNIARWDVEGRYLYINPTHERTLGVAASEVIGKPIPDTHDHVKAAIAQVVASGRSVELVRQAALVNGELQVHEVTLVPECDASGHVVSVLGLGRNMTEFYRMQETIAAREQEFRSLAESSPDAIVRYDREGCHRYLNTTLVHKLGLNSVEDVIGKRPAEVWPDGRFDPIEQAAARAIETGDAQSIEMRSSDESGVLVENLISVVPERDAHGNIVGTLAFGRDVTAIRATERKLAHFIGNLPGMAYTFRLSSDGAMGFTYVSPAIEEIFGRTEQEAMGDFQAVHEFVPAEDRERIETAVAESARNLSPKHVEFRICRPGQPERWLDARSLPERQSDGSILWYGIMLDVTERKRMEGALAERQAFLDSLFEAIPVPVFYKDREGRYQGFNRAYETVFGANREQLIGQSVFDTHPRELAETYHAKDEEVFERRVALQQYEYNIRHANGTLRDVLFSKAAFTDAHGEVCGLIGAVIDITERKQAELALRASEEQAQSRSNLLNAIVESSPDVIVFALDTQYRYLSFNRKHKETMRAIWGKEIAAGMSMLDVIGDHPDRETAKQGFDRALSGESFVQEDAYGDELISRQYWENYWSPIRAETGEVVGLTCFVMNVSERRQAEEALRESGEKLRNLYDYSPVGIALTDMNGRYIEFNESFRAICGYTHDELMALDYWTLTPREYEAQEMAQIDALEKTGRYGPYVKEYVRKDGSRVPIQLNGALIIGKDMKPYIWSIVEDITERKKTEALLKEKLERIVELNDYLEENSRTMEEHAVELEASQEQLKEALEFSNGVINAIPDILFEMDREGRYHGIWTQKPELLAAQKALLLNKTMHEALPPETADIALAAIRDAEEKGFSYGNVIDIALPSGEIRWFELSISRKLGGSPSDTRFIVLSRDVTDRKKTEDVLRFIAQGEWMQSGDSFVDTLVRYLGKLLDVDYVLIDKLSAEPGYVETVARYVKGEIAPNVRYALQSTPCGEVMSGIECCHGENIRGWFPESGLLRDMRAESYVGIPLLDIGGRVIGLIAVLDEQPLADAHFVKSILQMVASSVSAELERSRMEQVLRENFDALNEAQRISHIGNWELDLTSGALLWSDEIYRIFEIDPERFGASYDAFIDVIHPDDRETVNCAYSESLASREPYEVEHRLLFADGRIKYVHERCETRYDDEGKPLRSLGTVQDITARKQAEESLRESYEKISELNRHLENNAMHLEENARYLEEQTIELEASQEQIKQTEAWYRSILHSAPEGMLVVDDHGLIMQVNARLEAMFGYGSGELPGHRVEELLPQAVREAHAEQRAGYFASGAASRPAMVGKTLFGCRKDGSTFPVDVSLSRLPELDGRRSAVCASVRDITERQAMEVARETALAEAQRLAQLRSAFMAQMSHELRTPLNGILGYTQNLLQGDALGEKQVAGLNIIQHSGEHLLSLINGLLDHAAIEANKFELIEGEIELDQFLGAIIGIIRIRAEQKNLAFACEAGGDLPAVVRGDAQRLRQVLINLLANAVKFTDNGSVILRVGFIAPSRIRFEVQDSGVGIAADQLENIFLPFEQTGEIQRRAGGSGLGLAISRTLVRLMGGDIRVESRSGAGSTFSFEIEIGVVQSGRAGLDVAALSERAETRVAQATPMLPAPPRQELDALHALALRGSMRDVTRHADKLAEADARYQPFAAQLRRLAQSFQTKALLGLIEQYRNREQEE